ncbi:hypothetical protein [Streptomyces sp. NBC_00197]|uniref:hypothetical protein n=1 Tax=Streptomyces sp. NBC_00197 TaxID=2975676 RepID=UPI00324B8F6A
MTYEDPFATAPANDQFDTTTKETAPVTETNTASAVASNPNPFKIGFTLKSAGGYDAEWLTPAVYGGTAQETAERGRDLLVAMQEVGLIDLTAKAANYVRSQHIGAEKPADKPSFQGGKVQYNNGGGQERPADVPAHFTFKTGNKNGKQWSAWFPPKGSDEKPIWV